MVETEDIQDDNRNKESKANQAIKLDEQLHGAQSLQVANDWFNLTRSLRRQSNWDGAGTAIMRTLEIRRKLYAD